MALAINSIVNADCLMALSELHPRSVNFVLTEPPYLVRYQSRDGRTVPNDDNQVWLKPAFREIFRVLERDSYAVSFYGWQQADRFVEAFRAAGFRLIGHLTFTKAYASSTHHLRYQHECAYLLAKGRPAVPAKPIADVIPWQYTGNRHHPTEKPLAILRPLIETFSRRGQTVLDPFCGSGSSLVAAKELGRNYIGIELDIGYHATALRRLSKIEATPPTSVTPDNARLSPVPRHSAERHAGCVQPDWPADRWWKFHI